MLPFGWMPGHWGLKGKTRERAKIEYELNGYERDLALANLELTDKELKNRINYLNKEYNKITLLEFQREDAYINYTGKELDLRILEVEMNEGKLTDLEYDKQKATINGEPWVHILNITPDSTDNPSHGNMELDWNDKFVEDLRESGYEGASDEQVVDLWLVDLCRNIAMEHFSGTGEFDDQVDAGISIKKEPVSKDKWAAS